MTHIHLGAASAGDGERAALALDMLKKDTRGSDGVAFEDSDGNWYELTRTIGPVLGKREGESR